jgi:transcriptional regulator with XRE-family HTH domain
MARRGDLGQNPTLRGRRRAMELQRRREATGMSREEVARQLEWSTSTIFRIETGRSRPQPGNVRTLLELYGVTGAERDGLIQLTREARQPRVVALVPRRAAEPVRGLYRPGSRRHLDPQLRARGRARPTADRGLRS